MQFDCKEINNMSSSLSRKSMSIKGFCSISPRSKFTVDSIVMILTADEYFYYDNLLRFLFIDWGSTGNT